MLIQLLETTSLLLEINFEKTKQQFFKKLVDRVIGDATFWDQYHQTVPFKDRPELLYIDGEPTEDREYFFQYAYDKLCQADPTNGRVNNPNAYSLWLIQRYSSGAIKRWEDLNTAREILAEYEQMKVRKVFQRMGPDGYKYKDIGGLKSIGDVLTAVRAGRNWLGETDTAKLRERYDQYIEEYLSDGIKIIYPRIDFEDDSSIDEGFDVYCMTGMVMLLKKVGASVRLFQKPTAWCTARPDNEFFDNYSEDAPLFVIDDTRNEHLYQIHWASDQFLDEDDSTPKSVFSIPMTLMKEVPIPIRELYRISRNGEPYTNLLSMVVNFIADDSFVANFTLEQAIDAILPHDGPAKVHLDPIDDFADVVTLYRSAYGKNPEIADLERWLNPNNAHDHLLVNSSEELSLIAYDKKYPASPELKTWAVKQLSSYCLGAMNILKDLDAFRDADPSALPDYIKDVGVEFRKNLLTDPEFLLSFLTMGNFNRQTNDAIMHYMNFNQADMDTMLWMLINVHDETGNYSELARYSTEYIRRLVPATSKSRKDTWPSSSVMKEVFVDIQKATAVDHFMGSFYSTLINHLPPVEYMEWLTLDDLVKRATNGQDPDMKSVDILGALIMYCDPDTWLHQLVTPNVIYLSFRYTPWDDLDRFLMETRLGQFLHLPEIQVLCRKALLERITAKEITAIAVIKRLTKTGSMMRIVNNEFAKALFNKVSPGRSPETDTVLAALVMSDLIWWITDAYPNGPDLDREWIVQMANSALFYEIEFISTRGGDFDKQLYKHLRAMVKVGLPINPNVFRKILVLPGGWLFLLGLEYNLIGQQFPEDVARIVYNPSYQQADVEVSIEEIRQALLTNYS